MQKDTKIFVTCFVGYAACHALGTWICHELFDKPGTKNPVTERVTAARNWICDLLFDAKNRVHAIVATADDNEELILETTREASPAHFQIKIEQLSLFSEYGIDKYETREFEAGGYKWRLVIYPDGVKREGGHISVHLTVAETSSLPMDWEFNAIFTIFLYNQILDNYLCYSLGRRFNETKCEWGFRKFISKEILRDKSNGYLVDDNLVLGAEVFVLKRQRVVERVTLLEPVYLTRNWKIPEFSKLGDVWISDEFLVKGFNWKVMLYPKGDFSSKDNVVEIYLTCVTADTFATHQKIKSKFFIRLMGKWESGVRRSTAPIRECALDHWFTSSSTSRGYSFRSLTEKDFPLNDCCTLQVQMCVQVIV